MCGSMATRFGSTDNGRTGWCDEHYATLARRWSATLEGRMERLVAKYRSVDGDLERKLRRLFLTQEGRCAVCEDGDRDLYVDHDHDTHVVRGLLCSQCNSALGMFRDNPLLILRAAVYLERTKGLGGLSRSEVRVKQRAQARFADRMSGS